MNTTKANEFYIGVRLPGELRDQIRSLSRSRGQSMSAAIRELVAAGLAAEVQRQGR